LIEQFHFLRPWWLLLLLPLAGLSWGLLRGHYDRGNWRTVVDERLMPYVLSGADGARRNGMRALLAAVALLSILALAGPTWERLPQPVYQKETALIILLDLSRSMNAADIKPSRLVRARHKIADILNLRIEGQTALVVYAADAFAVTPLTSDVATILALLPDLDSSLMPAQGSRADRAVELALGLFANTGRTRGDLLLVSDGVGARELRRIEELHRQNPEFRVSVLAVGTPDGGPIPLANGGFLKADDGSIVISGMLEDNLRQLAVTGGGVYATISNDDIDINTLTYLLESSIDSSDAHRAQDRSAEVWREFGPWLLLVALPLASLAFRRGLLWLLPLCIVAMPPDAQALDLQSWWQNDDQRASRLFEQGDYAAAAKTFEDPGWKASALYRAGDYQAALDNWSGSDGEDALYNRGNALARLERYDEALAAYDAILQQNPRHQDALFNKRAIEEFLQRRQQQQQNGQGERQQSGQGEQQQETQDGQQNMQQDGQQGMQQDGQQQGETSPQADGQQAQPSSSAGAEQQRTDSGQDQAGAAQQAREQPQDGNAQQPAQSAPGEDQALERSDEKMSAQAAEQWLRKIPDDPGGLLRRKFLYQYRERGGVADEAASW